MTESEMRSRLDVFLSGTEGGDHSSRVYMSVMAYAVGEPKYWRDPFQDPPRPAAPGAVLVPIPTVDVLALAGRVTYLEARLAKAEARIAELEAKR